MRLTASAISLLTVFLCLGTSGDTQVSDAKKGGKKDSVDLRHKDDDCNDSIKMCKKPVKYVSDDDKGCYTFSCKYGTAEAYNIRTKDEGAIKVLMDWSKEQGPSKRSDLPEKKK